MRLHRPRCSVLYVPAANARAMDKIPSLAADAVIFDLEDAVAPEAKAGARQALRAHFAAHPPSAQERIIRINAAHTEWSADDLAASVACAPDAVLLPKLETAQQLRDLRQALDASGGGAIRLWAMIETPLGMVNIGSIAALGRDASIGLDCLVVGSNDIARETGLRPASSRVTLQLWLAPLVLHARAYGLGILDGVYNDFRDRDGFASECAAGAGLGFDGKTLIHPAQIAAANIAFSPGAAELAEAEAIVAAFAAPENAGQGVLSLNGRMVERLHLDMARALLARAGLLPR